MNLIDIFELGGLNLPEVTKNTADFGSTKLFGGEIKISGIAGDQQASLIGQGCFAKGLSPREYFHHSLTGREGITDTAMKTATSGYIQRRMIKFSEDVHVSNDGTVRNLNNNIIEFAYGNNFLNSSNTIIKNGKIVPVDMQRLIQKINCDYEISNVNAK